MRLMRRDLYTDKNFQSNAVNHGHEPGEMTATRLYGAGVKKNTTGYLCIVNSPTKMFCFINQKMINEIINNINKSFFF